MDKLVRDLLAIIADYRAGELPSPDVRLVRRWIEQFDHADREPILAELGHVWKRLYVSRDRVDSYLQRFFVDSIDQKYDMYDYFRDCSFLNIQSKGESQAYLLNTLKHILGAGRKVDVGISEGSKTFIYLDDAIFTGKRALSDLQNWIINHAPSRSNILIVAICSHRLAEYRLSIDIPDFARKHGKIVKLKVFSFICLENRKSKRNSSDVLWPVSLPIGSERYLEGNMGHINRFPGEKSWLFSSEHGRHVLEQAFLKAGLKILSFCENPSPALRPLGFGPFGAGFGSLFVTWRNCPNTAPLALWWGDPSAPKGHPLSRWTPLLPRKTYIDDT